MPDSFADQSYDPNALRCDIRQFFDTTVPSALDGVTTGVARAKAYRAAVRDGGHCDLVKGTQRTPEASR